MISNINYWIPGVGFLEPYENPTSRCPHSLFGTTFVSSGRQYGWPSFYVNKNGEYDGSIIFPLKVIKSKFNTNLKFISYQGLPRLEKYHNSYQNYLVSF